MNLMTVDTRYVITNTKQLVSPKGFDHTQPVYMQTTIAIHCNNIPGHKDLPKNVTLYLHDIKKITEQ